MRRPRLLLGFTALALALAGGPACSGAKVSDAEYQARAIADAGARLQGTWLLKSFAPETAPEPMLRAMLEFQYGRLTARFDGAKMVAESPGIHVERTYRISEAAGDNFKVTAFDEHGVAYEGSCTFLDGHLEVRAVTEPWRGLAILTPVLAGAPPPR